MIRKIIIKNVASYKEGILNNLEKINLIYGLNGSGKTTLSNYLQKQDENKFKDCNIVGLNGEKILVYNQNFIKENFYDKDELQGIFTLSKVNAEAEKVIKSAKEMVQKLEEERENKNSNLQELKNKLDEKTDFAKNKVWEIKKGVEKSSLEYCIKGVGGSKDKMFEKVQGIKKSDHKRTRSIEELEKELSQLEDNQEIQQINLICIDTILGIENNNIFKEIIVGNDNSIIADFIRNLGSFDWVKQGVEHYVKEGSRCPFCQQETLTKEVRSEFEKYFDITFKEKIQRIRHLSQIYDDELQKLQFSSYLENFFVKNEEDRFMQLWNNFYNNLNENNIKIKQKIQNPSESIQLHSSQDTLKELNSFVNIIINKIKEHNKKIGEMKEVKQRIKDEFWQIKRWEYDEVISEYEKFNGQNGREIINCETEISSLHKQIQEQDEIINKYQKKTINIEKTISCINQNLKDLGLVGIEIARYQERYYRVIRDGDDQSVFQSLSEGEKMIISFLYFLELCKGKESATELDRKKIVVIDDPISSLSHNHIFNVAQLIKQMFFKKDNNEIDFEQVFILTHNLYFFSECVKLLPKEKKMSSKTRILRDQENFSSFKIINDGEILNDYQAYWQILKDFKEHNMHSLPIIPNVARNILECFFGFVDNTKLNDVVNKLDSVKYNSLIRYINRESHYDRENIYDFKDIDIDIFLQGFQEIFKKSGYEKHYEKMMDSNKN